MDKEMRELLENMQKGINEFKMKCNNLENVLTIVLTIYIMHS